MNKNKVTQYILERVISGYSKEIDLDTTMVIYNGKKLCRLSEIFDYMAELSFSEYYYKTIVYNGVELIGDVKYSRHTNNVIIE